MTEEARRELLELLSGLCDGDLDGRRHARLEALLAEDAEARRLYLQYIDMHARLLVRPVPAVKARPAAERASRARSPLFRYALVAGLTLAASLLVQLAWRRPAPPPGQ